MKRSLIFLVIITINFSLISCFRDNNIPKANLEFIEFKKSNIKSDVIDIYQIKFLSDLEISNSVFEHRGFPHLMCLLTNEKDFGIKDIDNAEIRLIGYIKSKGIYKNLDNAVNNKILNKTKKFEYEIEILFYNHTESDNKYSSKNDIEKNLLNLSCVTCKLEKRYYLNTSKPYLSNPMCIPTENIIKVIKD